MPHPNDKVSPYRIINHYRLLTYDDARIDKRETELAIAITSFGLNFNPFTKWVPNRFPNPLEKHIATSTAKMASALTDLSNK